VVHDGKVYDITDFVPKHPGGARLWAVAGLDITVLFAAMHPPRVTVETHLAQYCIGVMQPAAKIKRTNTAASIASTNSGVSVKDPAYVPVVLHVSEEYQALRTYVWTELEKDFGTNKFANVLRSPTTWRLWYPLCSSLYYGALLAMLFLPQDLLPFWGRVLLALITGVLSAHISFVIHDVTHYRMRYSGLIWGVVLGDFSGFWTHAFLHEHLEHHRSLGDEFVGADVFDNMPLLRHRACEKRYPWHCFQHWYFPVGWSIFLLNAFFTDFFYICRPYNRCNNIITLLLPKVMLPLVLILSAIYGPFQGVFLWQLPFLLALLFAVAGCVILAVVGVVHHAAQGDSHKEVVCASGISGTGDFMQMVIHNSISIIPRWKVLNFLALGLSYHVEHHLFPSVPYWLLPRVNKLVRHHFEEKGIVCNNNLSHLAAFRLYVKTLRQLGRQGEKAATAGEST